MTHHDFFKFNANSGDRIPKAQTSTLNGRGNLYEQLVNVVLMGQALHLDRVRRMTVEQAEAGLSFVITG